jgi:hypothetical protein
MTMTRRASLAASLVVPALLAVAALRSGAADEKPTPAAARSDGSDKGRYYEMRIYTAAPGKMDALHKRFRDHTLKLFEKHGIRNVGYWTGTGKNEGKLYFIISYPSEQSREKHWNAFANDPDWQKAKKASEESGALVAGVEQVFMNPTDYSPVK